MVGRIKINMDKAREIRRNQIRREREAQFAELDREFMLALESGDNKERARVVAAKQRLRDAPAHPDIDRAKTVEELRAVRPINPVRPVASDDSRT